MKKIFSLIALIALSVFGYAQNSEKQVTAVFSYAQFALADMQPYVETYLSFDAWNTQFVKQSNGSMRSTIAIELMVTRGDSTVYAKKYNLNSPAVSEDVVNESIESGSSNLDYIPNGLRFNFMDVQRMQLDNGIYNIHFNISDANSKAAPVTIDQKVVLNYNRKRASLSSILPVANVSPTTTKNILSRSGYDMEPYVNDFYPEQVKDLSIYYEIYNIEVEIHGKDFITMSYIENQETGVRLESTLQGKRMALKETTLINGEGMAVTAPGMVTPVFNTTDISMLPSGNYNLVVEVRNLKNDLVLYDKMPFFRSNPSVKNEAVPVSSTFAGQINEETQMNLYLRALYPIALEQEKGKADNLASQPGMMIEKQEFFYHFWLRRNPTNPEQEWRQYKERLDYVQTNFQYVNTPGYLTDRGRVYLQYGAPDYVRDEKNFVTTTRGLSGGKSLSDRVQSQMQGQSDNNLRNNGQIFYLPYQLWRYNNIPTQDANRVFIFWDELRSGNYRLLVSSARGEKQEIGWERRLSQRQLAEDAIGEVGIQYQRGY